MDVFGKTGLFGLIAYTPWMNREADSLVLSVQLIDRKNSTDELTVTILTKNYEDTTESSVGSAMTVSSVGVTSGAYNDLKEQIRIKVEVGNSMGTTDGWCHYRILQPNFFEEQQAL